MVTVMFGRYIATAEVKNNKNIFKALISHKIPMDDLKELDSIVKHWFKDHYGFVSVWAGKSEIVRFCNYKKFVQEMHNLGLEVKVYKNRRLGYENI